MKFQKSLLTRTALAATMLAFGASASAAILGAGVNNISPAENNSELIFIAYSPTVEASYVLDLGVSIADMNANAGSAAGYSFSRSMTSAFTGSPLAAAADLRWAVAVFDTYTATDALKSGDLQLLTTVATPSAFSTASPGLTGEKLSNAVLSWQNFTGIVNNQPGHVGAGNVNGSSYNVKADGAAYVLDAFAPGPNLNNNFAYSQYNPVGTASKFYYMTACAADDCLFDGSLNVLARAFGNAAGDGVFTFNGNALAFNVTPIPEPGTYAMLALGLMAIGAKVRRRQQG